MKCLRLSFFVIFLLCAAAKKPGCDGAFLRLVDYLTANGNRLTTEKLSTLSESPTAINPADLLDGSESSKQAWRKAFGVAMTVPGFRWESAREALATRVSRDAAKESRREEARGETAPVLTPKFVAELSPTSATFHHASRVGDEVYLSSLAYGSLAINTATLSVRAGGGPGTFFEVGGRRMKIDGGRLTDLTTNQTTEIWGGGISEGERYERFGRREIVFGKTALSARVSAIDGGRPIALRFPLGRNWSPPGSGNVGRKKVIAFYEGDGGRLMLVDPLRGTSVGIRVPLGENPSAPTFFDAGRRAVVRTDEGFHFVDLAPRRKHDLGIVFATRGEGAFHAIRPVKIIEHDGRQLGAIVTSTGVALADLHERKLVNEIPAEGISSEIATVTADGKLYLVWGDDQGAITIADPISGVVSKNRVRAAGRLSVLAPFERDGDILAVVASDTAPALVQLYGKLKRQ